MAVGNDYHSVLSMDDDLVKNLFQSAKEENEPFGVYHLKIFIAHKLIHLLPILLILVLFQLGRGQVQQRHFIVFYKKLSAKLVAY